MGGILSAQETYANGRLMLKRTDGVATITFNNPDKLNAMNLSTWQALGDLCEALASDESLRVLTLEGSGDRAFVVGADISEFGKTRNNAAVSDSYNKMVARAEAAVLAMPVPTIAAIRGFCIGGGFGLAMCCDIRLACEDAQFAVTPARLGLGYGYDGITLLSRHLGHSTTADMLFSGRKLAAHEALAKGLCTCIYSLETFDADCTAYIDQLGRNAPLTIRTVKAALRDLARTEAKRDRSKIDAMVKICFDSADYHEGQLAFMEKRPPRFKGK